MYVWLSSNYYISLCLIYCWFCFLALVIVTSGIYILAVGAVVCFFLFYTKVSIPSSTVSPKAAGAKRGWELLRVGSRESFLQLIDYYHLRPNKRKLSTTLKKKLSRSKSMRAHESHWEHMRVTESTWEFQAKQEREFELSATHILIWPWLSTNVLHTATAVLTRFWGKN